PDTYTLSLHDALPIYKSACRVTLMKIPQTPPNIESYLAHLDSREAMSKVGKLFSASLGPYDSKGRYLPWDKLRHLTPPEGYDPEDRKSTRLNSSHVKI